VEKFNIDTTEKAKIPYDCFQYKNIPTFRSVSLNSISFGNNAFANGLGAFVLKDEPYLRELGVAGIVGGAIFQRVVLTIDSQRKKLTMSQPYRPSYMKLTNRANAQLLQGVGMECPITIDGVTFSCMLDTWNKGLVELNATDFARLTGTAGKNVQVYAGYGKTLVMVPAKVVGQCDFVRMAFKDVSIAENKSLIRSVIGTEILKHGLLSVDFLRQTIYFQPFDEVTVKDDVIENHVTVESGKVNEITGVYFRENIHDYLKETDFTFKGDKPVVIDFWASWCGPCMKMMPFMEQLAAKYKDKVIFLKVNADKEKELCNKFGINALPTFMFLPMGGKPIQEIGAEPGKVEKIIMEQLLK
jgi:thioredoxin